MLDCVNNGGDWLNKSYNFDDIYNSIITLFWMTTSSAWLEPTYTGIDSKEPLLEPQVNARPYLFLFFISFMIIGHIFFWNVFVGVMIENFNRVKDRVQGYVLMTEEQRNWVEMQRFMIDRKLKVKVEESENRCRKLAKKITLSNKFEYIIIACILLNTLIMALQYYRMDQLFQEFVTKLGYVFIFLFNLEILIKVIASGKRYFKKLINLYDFIVILGTDIGIFIQIALPQIQVGPLPTLLRTFRIGRVLRLIRYQKRLKMLIDTITYTMPYMLNIVVLMFMVIIVYAVIGMKLFSNVIHQKEISENANFENFGNAVLLLFRCATGERWAILMYEYAFDGSDSSYLCVKNQTYDDYLKNGPKACGNSQSYYFFISYVIIMSLMVMNIIVAVILEGASSFSIKNNKILTSNDYDQLIEKWVQYDPHATGWIKPKNLALLIYELPMPLGKAEEYKEILQKTLQFNARIRNNLDDRKRSMKYNYIYNLEREIILPHSTVLKLLCDLKLPVYKYQGRSLCHFKDVCQTLTKQAIQRYFVSQAHGQPLSPSVQNFDNLPEEQQKRLNKGWIKKYRNLQKAKLIDDYDTGRLWAGLYILKMMRHAKNVGKSPFKRKLVQSRLLKKLQGSKLKTSSIDNNSSKRQPSPKANQLGEDDEALEISSFDKVSRLGISKRSNSPVPSSKRVGFSSPTNSWLRLPPKKIATLPLNLNFDKKISQFQIKPSLGLKYDIVSSKVNKKLSDMERSTWWKADDSNKRMLQWIKNEDKRIEAKKLKEQEEIIYEMQ